MAFDAGRACFAQFPGLALRLAQSPQTVACLVA